MIVVFSYFSGFCVEFVGFNVYCCVVGCIWCVVCDGKVYIDFNCVFVVYNKVDVVFCYVVGVNCLVGCVVVDVKFMFVELDYGVVVGYFYDYWYFFFL